MTERRGMTLLEVLAATVLLAVLAGTCIPTLRHAARALSTPSASFDLYELAALADAFVEGPSEFGMAPDALPSEFELHWPELPDHDPVRVRIVTPDAPDTEHLWLTFATDEWFVLRWMKRPEGTP